MGEVFVFLIDGFEEIEAIATVDILRRGGVEVRMVSLTGSEMVTGGHGILVKADSLFEHTDYTNARMLVLPGGTPDLDKHQPLKELLAAFDAKKGKIAAICAAPMVLGNMGLLEGKRATCYPGFERYLKGSTFTWDPVVTDLNITTGRGPGLTFVFALTLLSQLEGLQKADQIAEGLLLS